MGRNVEPNNRFCAARNASLRASLFPAGVANVFREAAMKVMMIEFMEASE